VTTALVTRSAAAALYWARRRDDDAIVGSLHGLSEDERLAVRGVLQARTLSNLTDDELLKLMLELGSKQAKVLQAERKSAVLVDAPSDLGSFSGYLAVIGNRDLQGDMLDLGSMDATVADWTAGKYQWFITDSHSDRASDVVAEVVDAALDATGLRIKAVWLATERAQELRALVRVGVRLGLSIDYFPVAGEPDSGGRRLSEVLIVGGALTPKPANPLAVVVEGKATTPLAAALPASAPCGDLYRTMQAESERRDPARARLQQMAEVVAASWVSPALAKSIGVEAAYRLVEGAAELAAARQAEGDPVGQLERARWEQANRYSADLAAWLDAHR
jgi:HK97 family phage prohead protease